MSQHLSRARPLEAAIYSLPGEIIFRFTHVVVQVAFAVRGSSCLRGAEDMESDDCFSGSLMEISVFNAKVAAKSLTENAVIAFPFSPSGHPLPFATVDQLASIMQWASLLESTPAKKGD